MPQSEKDGEKRRGDKEEEWQCRDKGVGKKRESTVIAVGCLDDIQLSQTAGVKSRASERGKEMYGIRGG